MEYIYPKNDLMAPSLTYVGGLPSILVPRSLVSNEVLLTVLNNLTNICFRDGNCHVQELFQDITGNLNSP
jgi:hypothetical protein